MNAVDFLKEELRKEEDLLAMDWGRSFDKRTWLVDMLDRAKKQHDQITGETK